MRRPCLLCRKTSVLWKLADDTLKKHLPLSPRVLVNLSSHSMNNIIQRVAYNLYETVKHDVTACNYPHMREWQTGLESKNF